MEELMKDSDQQIAVEEGTSAISPQLREMVRAGLIYGRAKSKTHPRMKPFVAATRNGVELIDLEKTVGFFERAREIVRGVVASGGTILFVDTHPSSRDLVEGIAKEFGYPFVTNRWIGGTLTNLKAISSRIAAYQTMKGVGTKKQTIYTKKELLMMNRKVERMQTLFGGVENMRGIPQLLFIVNSGIHETAIHEAHACHVPVVAVMSTDADPDSVEHPIPANDSAREGIQWLLDGVRTAIEEGIRDHRAAAAEKENPAA